MFSTWPPAKKNYQENLELPEKSAKGFKQQLIQVEFEILVLWEKTENADSGFLRYFFASQKIKQLKKFVLTAAAEKLFKGPEWPKVLNEKAPKLLLTSATYVVKNIGAKIAATK